MIKNVSPKMKAHILSIAFIVALLVIFISAFLEEFEAYSFANGLPTFSAAIPAFAGLLSLINWFFSGRYGDGRKFAKWSVIVFCFMYLLGIICGFIHYEIPLPMEAHGYYVYLVGPGMLVAIVFGSLIFTFSKLYYKWKHGEG